MAVELILLDNVTYLGEIGETVKVADGYARNYLVPKGLASKATPGILRRLEAKKRRRQQEYEKQVSSYNELAEKLAGHSVTIPVQTGDNDKLYGSVTAQQIIESLEEMNFEIEKKQIVLREPIRELGMYSVDIHLHPEVTATIKVWIVKA